MGIVFVILMKKAKFSRFVLGSFFEMEKLGSARWSKSSAWLGSARQKVGPGATLMFSLVSGK